MNGKRLLKTLVIGLLALIYGCGGPDESIDPSNTLRLALSAEPPTLDWSLATDNVSFDVLTNLMEGLTQYDDNLNPIPAIAKRWEFSEDGKTITFYLREDVTWTDGTPVTAEQFVYSWRRLLNPQTAAQYAYFLFDVVNAAEYNSGKIKDPDKVGVKALSPYVLEVKLKRPVIYFPSLTTFMVTFPQRQDLIEKHSDHWTDPENMVTNGPFRLVEWKHEYKLVLKRNSNYYDTAPSLDGVLYYVVRQPTTELTLYETGELDASELPPVAIAHYEGSPDFQRLPLLRGYYYGFNVQKPPFDNPLVRRALSHAIDRSRIPHILKGGELPTASWIPKGMFGYNEGVGPKFDPVKARELMKQAGFGPDKPFPVFTLAYNTAERNNLMAEFVQAQWQENLGLDVKLDKMEWKVFLSKLAIDAPPVFRLGWGADFPDPDNFMNLFTSTSGNNRMNWANAKYDALIARGASERDPVARQKIYDEAQTLLTETDASIISLFIQTQNILIKPHVKGLTPNALEWMYLKRVSLERN